MENGPEVFDWIRDNADKVSHVRARPFMKYYTLTFYTRDPESPSGFFSLDGQGLIVDSPEVDSLLRELGIRSPLSPTESH